MAYLNLLASVSQEEVAAFIRDPQRPLKYHLVQGVSHLIAYWVEIQPLGYLLRQALDGGHLLSATLWHPLRHPTYHSPDDVRAFLPQLSQAWDSALAQSAPWSEDDWYRIEIEKVLRVFEHATACGGCVVSVLQPPADRWRARRVRVPLVPASSAG
jgi:hypothetical protein